MAIAARCLEETFSLTGKETAERIEGVEVFKYLGRLLNWSVDDWSEVLCNTRKAHYVLGRLGKLLWSEGAEPAVSETFYRMVVQVVLFFGVETWVRLAPKGRG